MPERQISYRSWFGEPWPRPDYRAPVCEDDAHRVATPVGETCLLCEEPIEAEHQGTFMFEAETARLVPVHRECSLRSVVGPVAALERRCAHTGGTDPCMPEGQSYRESALATTHWIERNGVLR